MFNFRHVGEERELNAEHGVFRVDPAVSGCDAYAKVSGVIDPAVDVAHRSAYTVQLAEDDHVD